MSRKFVLESVRVVVEVGRPGWMGVTESDWLALGRDVARKLRMLADQDMIDVPVSGISSDPVYSSLCEHCGAAWTEDSKDYNGGCCDKDVEVQS